MDKVLRAIIAAKYDRCVARVVYRLRRISSREWQGDDSPERSLWDHWKREMQEEHSTLHNLIEDEVEVVAWAVINTLPVEEQQLLTLGTDALDGLDEEPETPVFDPSAVLAELMQRVNERAINEPHRAAVQHALDDQALDRHERDMEPYQQ